MGSTRDLWTRPERSQGLYGPTCKTKRCPHTSCSAVHDSVTTKRVPTDRWGKGKRWQARWLDPDEEPQTATFAKRRPADLHWQKMETDRERGTYFDPKAGKDLFESVATRWFSTLTIAPNSIVVYERAYRLHVKPVFGHRQVKAIKPSETGGFQAALGEKYKRATVLAARRVLLGVLDLAVDDELIRRNPARAKSIPPIPRDAEVKIVAWPLDLVLRLIDAHPAPQRVLPQLGAGAGLRIGEQFGVAVEDIDYDEQVIHVRRQIRRVGNVWVFAPPKGNKVRDVPLPDFLAQYLRAHIDQHRPRPVTLPWVKETGKPVTHTVLVHWTDDRHMRHDNYLHSMWHPLIAKVGIIPPPTIGPRGRKVYETTRREGPHTLRHHYASLMLAEGVSIRDLSDYLGHHDPAFTLSMYAHLMPDSHERARHALDRLMFRPRPVASDGT